MAATAADPEAALYGLLVDTTLRQLADTQQQARLYGTTRALASISGGGRPANPPWVAP